MSFPWNEDSAPAPVRGARRGRGTNEAPTSLWGPPPAQSENKSGGNPSQRTPPPWGLDQTKSPTLTQAQVLHQRQHNQHAKLTNEPKSFAREEFVAQTSNVPLQKKFEIPETFPEEEQRLVADMMNNGYEEAQIIEAIMDLRESLKAQLRNWQANENERGRNKLREGSQEMFANSSQNQGQMNVSPPELTHQSVNSGKQSRSDISAPWDREEKIRPGIRRVSRNRSETAPFAVDEENLKTNGTQHVNRGNTNGIMQNQKRDRRTLKMQRDDKVKAREEGSKMYVFIINFNFSFIRNFVPNYFFLKCTFSFKNVQTLKQYFSKIQMCWRCRLAVSCTGFK